MSSQPINSTTTTTTTTVTTTTSATTNEASTSTALDQVANQIEKECECLKDSDLKKKLSAEMRQTINSVDFDIFLSDLRDFIGI